MFFKLMVETYCFHYWKVAIDSIGGSYATWLQFDSIGGSYVTWLQFDSIGGSYVTWLQFDSIGGIYVTSLQFASQFAGFCKAGVLFNSKYAR